MTLPKFAYTAFGLLAGAALTLSTTGIPVKTAAAQSDAHAAAQKAQVMVTTFHLDKAGLHDIDESLAAGNMPPGALGNVRRARIATQATDWPQPVRETSTKLVHHMVELEEALKAEDISKAAPLAKEVHEVEHDLSSAVYSWLTGEQPAPAKH